MCSTAASISAAGTRPRRSDLPFPPLAGEGARRRRAEGGKLEEDRELSQAAPPPQPSPASGGGGADAMPPLRQFLLSPQSVAIVGQSNDPTKAAGRPLKFLRQAGYAGRVYLVNARRETVLGERAYPSL